MFRRDLLAAVAAVTVPASAWAADGPPPDRDRSQPENYHRPVPGTDLVIAGAIIGVNAPLAAVKKVLLAYHRYKDILPRLQQSRVVAEDNGTNDVYMRAPILNGLAAIWGVMRFSPVKPWGKRGIQIDGELLKGNINKWHGTWIAFPCGAKRTLLKIELFIDLDVPVPTSVVNRNVLWAARKGVSAVRDMAECGQSEVRND
jgi:hypothetical protein